MARSASYDFSQDRNSLIKDALITAQVIDESETMTSTMEQSAQRLCNRMIKAWQADGLQMWIHKEATLFLELDKIKYQLGSTGDHATASYTETAIKVAASDTDTTIDVDSTTGMTAGDNIGIEMDDGTMHWTTVSSVTDSDTVVIASGIDDDAAVDNVVFFYTTKIPRPLRIVGAWLREHSGSNDNELTIISRDEYWDLGVKTTEGRPTQIYFDPLLDLSEVRVYPEPDDVKDIIKMIVQYPYDDMDSSSDDFALPQYWYDAIHYNLAYRLAMDYLSMTQEQLLNLRIMATQTKKHAMDFDIENTDIYLVPDV